MKGVKWVKARVERQPEEENTNMLTKIVTIKSNSFEKLIIQPWLEGGELITATPENQDLHAPYGHAGWTFDSENEAIVVVTIEN